eukprot:scaffold1573_cov173-Amphora_coffeaeformis.AAC.15
MALGTPYFDRMAQVVSSDGFLEDPESPFFADLTNQRIRRLASIYIIPGVKVGSSGNTKYRDSIYVNEKGYDPGTLRVIVPFDRMGPDLDMKLQIIYAQYMETVMKSPLITAFQRTFFECICKRGGEELGIKRVFIRKMLEIGFSRMLGYPNIGECLMSDKKFKHASDGCAWITAIPSKMNIPGYGTSMVKQGAIGSWEPDMDPNNLSSKIVAIELCVQGGRRVDTLAFPADPGVIFDDNYSGPERAGGREVWHEEIADMEEDGGVYISDANSVIFQKDKYFRKTIHNVLEKRGWVFRGQINDEGSRETVLHTYKDRAALMVVLPFCYATDSRPKVSHSKRIRRSRSIAVVCNVMRVSRGEPMLSEADIWENPINAAMALHISHRGLNQGLRTCCAFARDFLTKESVFALKQNNLPKLPTDLWYPVSHFSRRVLREQTKNAVDSDDDDDDDDDDGEQQQQQQDGYDIERELIQKKYRELRNNQSIEHGIVNIDNDLDDNLDDAGEKQKRVSNALIIDEARRIITQVLPDTFANDNEMKAWLGLELLAHFSQDGATSGAISARWTQLYKQVRKDSGTYEILKEIRRKQTASKGNTTCHTSATSKEIQSNDDMLIQMIQGGKPFWIPFKPLKAPGKFEDQMWNETSTCGKHSFAEYNRYEFAYESLRRRFGVRNMQDNTEALTSTKIKGYALNKALQTRDGKRKGQAPGVQMEDTTGKRLYLLMQIVLEEDSQNNHNASVRKGFGKTSGKTVEEKVYKKTNVVKAKKQKMA